MIGPDGARYPNTARFEEIVEHERIVYTNGGGREGESDKGVHFRATVTFVGNTQGETQTIAGAIYVLIQTPGGDASALRLAVVSAAIAIVALVISEALQRGLGRRA